MIETLCSMTRRGLTDQRHVLAQAAQDRKFLLSQARQDNITISAWNGSAVQPLCWWDRRGRSIFRNSDGGYVRVDLTAKGRKLYSA